MSLVVDPHVCLKVIHCTVYFLLQSEFLTVFDADDVVVHVNVDLVDLSEQKTNEVAFVHPLILNVEPKVDQPFCLVEASQFRTVPRMHSECIVEVNQLISIISLLDGYLDGVPHANVSMKDANLLQLKYPSDQALKPV